MENTLAIESEVVLNLWGMVVHQLYQTVQSCEMNRFSLQSEGIHSIDEAVAYWIGSTQVKGDAGEGKLLYCLAEEGAEWFNTKSHDNQSKANWSILRLFKDIAIKLIYQGACYSEQNSFNI